MAFVQFPPSLVRQLDLLTEALQDPGTDLVAILSVLTDDITAAVPSFLGLIMTVYLDEDAVTVTTIESPTAATCLQLCLTSPATATPAGDVVFYAADAGAFTDLAAGLKGHVLIDSQLPPPNGRLYPSEAIGLADLSDIHQATGVLMDQGHYRAAQARAALEDHAGEQDLPLPGMARRVLAQLHPVRTERA